MEHIFSVLGEVVVFGLVVVTISLPLGAVGLWLRWRGGRRGLRWGLIDAARRELREIGSGRVAVVGSWKNLGDGRGLVEEGEARAVVEHGGIEVADGRRVLVAGYATRQVDDPRGADYRSGARVWLVEGAGEELVVSEDLDRPRHELRAARVGRLAGAVMLALGLATTAAMGAICYQVYSEWVAFERTSWS